MNYTESQLISLAKGETEKLIKLLISATEATKVLIMGAEILTEEIDDETLVLPVLLSLLKNKNAALRECAATLFFSFYEKNKSLPQDVIDILTVVAATDPSHNIKSYVNDMLNEI